MKPSQPNDEVKTSKLSRLFSLRSWTPKLAIARLVIIIIILAVGSAIWDTKPASRSSSNNKKSISVEESRKAAITNRVNNLKKSKDLDHMRSLAITYETTGDYASEASLYKQIAAKTGVVDDYIELLTISTQAKVPNKGANIDTALQKLKPKTNTLDFKKSYIIARQLDTAGRGKDALGFYEQADKVYDPAQTAIPDTTQEKVVYTWDKAKIESRINELRK